MRIGIGRRCALEDIEVFETISSDMTPAALGQLVFEGLPREHEEGVQLLRVRAIDGIYRVPHADVVRAMMSGGQRWLSFKDFIEFLGVMGRAKLVNIMSVEPEGGGKKSVMPLVVMGPAFAPTGESRKDDVNDGEPWYILIYPSTNDPETALLNLGFGYPSIGWPTDWQFLVLGKADIK